MAEPLFNVPLFKVFPHLIRFQLSEINVDVTFLTFKIFFSLLLISTTTKNCITVGNVIVNSLYWRENMAFLEKQTARSRAVNDDTKCGHRWPFFASYTSDSV